MSAPIKREDIRKGDRVRQTFEFTALCDLGPSDPGDDARYELIERPVVLPVVPGIYEDAEGNPWRLHFGSEDVRQEWTLDAHPMPDETVRQYAPFTLLRPVAEVAAEVLAALAEMDDAETRSGTCAYTKRHIEKLSKQFGVSK